MISGPPGDTIDVIHEMKNLKLLWSIIKVSCQANSVADSLAKWAASRRFFWDITFSVLPSFCFCLRLCGFFKPL